MLKQLIGLCVVLFSTSAICQEAFEDQLRLYDRDDIHSIHKKLYTKEGRHEVGLNVGGITNHGGYGYLSANYQYHFFENAGIEAAMGGFGFTMGDNERLLIYQASLTFSPLYGKLSLFTWSVFNFDIYVLAGAGLVSYNGRTSGSSFAGNVGLGQRIFLNDWLSAKIEFRDFIYSKTNPSGSVSSETVLNNYAITVGVAVLVPFRQNY